MVDRSSLDQKRFRRALGLFATGVTIVTARDATGLPVGITANSFNSVSLDPPMVLWSLAKTAYSLPTFTRAAYWNVHVLSVHQEALSTRFARSGGDKFTALEFDPAINDAPLLSGCTARFQCRTKFVYEGGDHIILVGEVLAHDETNHPPLLYVSGRYALATPRAGDVATAPGACERPALFSENLLGFLLGRAHHLYMNGFRHALTQHSLGDSDFYVLSLLALQPSLTLENLEAHLSFTGVDISLDIVQSLHARGFVCASPGEPPRYHLSDQGETVVLHAMAACKAVEEDLAGRLGEHETASLRNLLKRVITASDPGLPKVWLSDKSGSLETRPN
jgi:3-hydroxy-9,10-secoandrosta-1,3,5(10)-triene-9,17-dione monooxygenase reductase component